MVRNILLESEFVYVGDIFERNSFDRSALIVFINGVNNSDYSSDVLNFIKNERKLKIDVDTTIPEASRMGTMVYCQDDASSIDVFGIVTRLYEEDVDYEPFINLTEIRGIDGFNGDHLYKNLFVEYVDGFEYEWLSAKMDHHSINLVY